MRYFTVRATSIHIGQETLWLVNEIISWSISLIKHDLLLVCLIFSMLFPKLWSLMHLLCNCVFYDFDIKKMLKRFNQKLQGYVYSIGYVYSFWPKFPRLRLFHRLRLFDSLEYVITLYCANLGLRWYWFEGLDETC